MVEKKEVGKEDKIQELVKKYNINLEKLEKEQEKLAKNLEIKDSRDFSEVVKVGGFSNVFFQNKIISAIIVMDRDCNVINQKYFSDKVKFPYIPGFRAYRELPAMTNCFQELEDKPEVIFILGHGISHPRLGIASHFSLVSGVPTIGIAESLIIGEVRGEDVVYKEKVVGKVLVSREGSRPLYISPGNLISMKTALELARKFIKFPHKLPEPLHIAHRYSKEIREELSG